MTSPSPRLLAAALLLVALTLAHAAAGDEEIDAAGLVVAPGFIDLHAHGQREFEAWLQAQDGVTTQLDMEIGVYPVAAWYANRAGNAPINYGATVSHPMVRIATLVDLGALGLTEQDLAIGLANSPHFDAIARQRSWMEDPASNEQIAAMQQRLQQGLDEGALGMGYGINYTTGATREEIYRLFALAHANGVINFVHARFGADADLVLFDPATIADRATFAEPALPSAGIEHVLVNGVFVVRDGEPQRGSYPGQAVRRGN